MSYHGFENIRNGGVNGVAPVTCEAEVSEVFRGVTRYFHWGGTEGDCRGTERNG